MPGIITFLFVALMAIFFTFEPLHEASKDPLMNAPKFHYEAYQPEHEKKFRQQWIEGQQPEC